MLSMNWKMDADGRMNANWTELEARRGQKSTPSDLKVLRIKSSRPRKTSI